MRRLAYSRAATHLQGAVDACQYMSSTGHRSAQARLSILLRENAAPWYLVHVWQLSRVHASGISAPAVTDWTASPAHRLHHSLAVRQHSHGPHTSKFSIFQQHQASIKTFLASQHIKHHLLSCTPASSCVFVIRIIDAAGGGTISPLGSCSCDACQDSAGACCHVTPQLSASSMTPSLPASGPCQLAQLACMQPLNPDRLPDRRAALPLDRA